MKRGKQISPRKAEMLLRGGSVLLLTHTVRGMSWFIVGPEGGEVSEATAQGLLALNQVQPAFDGLFGTSQTYRWRSSTAA